MGAQYSGLTVEPTPKQQQQQPDGQSGGGDPAPPAGAPANQDSTEPMVLGSVESDGDLSSSTSNSSSEVPAEGADTSSEVPAEGEDTSCSLKRGAESDPATAPSVDELIPTKKTTPTPSDDEDSESEDTEAAPGDAEEADDGEDSEPEDTEAAPGGTEEVGVSGEAKNPATSLPMLTIDINNNPAEEDETPATELEVHNNPIPSTTD